MNMWKDVISQLAKAGQILAKWHLASGVTFYMYLPAVSEMGDQTIKVDSDVRFDELVHLDIMKSWKLGRLTVTNELDAVRRALDSARHVRVTELRDGDGIRVSLDTSASR
jgi:hypothetical protein